MNETSRLLSNPVSEGVATRAANRYTETPFGRVQKDCLPDYTHKNITVRIMTGIYFKSLITLRICDLQLSKWTAKCT